MLNSAGKNSAGKNTVQWIYEKTGILCKLVLSELWKLAV